MGTTALKHCTPKSIGKYEAGTLEVRLLYASATPNRRNGEVDVLDGSDPNTANKLATFTEEELAVTDPQTGSTVGTQKDIPKWKGGLVYLHLRTEDCRGERSIRHRVTRHPPKAAQKSGSR